MHMVLCVHVCVCGVVCVNIHACLCVTCAWYMVVCTCALVCAIVSAPSQCWIQVYSACTCISNQTNTVEHLHTVSVVTKLEK